MKVLNMDITKIDDKIRISLPISSEGVSREIVDIFKNEDKL